MRIVGLDLGSKTIGVAVSDEMGWTAQPVTVIRRQSVVKDVAEVGRLAGEYETDRVVMGLPINMNGTPGPMAEKARDFGGRLEQAGLKVDYWDERLSTASAERVLIEADVSRAKRKKVIDKVAAAVILQAYLDRQSGSGGPG